MNKVHDRAAWISSNGVWLTAMEQVEAVDLVAQDMERIWGVGRLRLVVDLALREKFDRQRVKLDRAIWEGPTLEAVRVEAQRMINGWRALDAAAKASGVQPAPVDAWETLLPDGSVLAVCRTDADACAYRQPGQLTQGQPTQGQPTQGQPTHGDERSVVVWSLEEVARLVGTTALALTQAKQAFPGAWVENVRRPMSDPVLGVVGGLDDPIPF